MDCILGSAWFSGKAREPRITEYQARRTGWPSRPTGGERS
jgi:hypothetical protein